MNVRLAGSVLLVALTACGDTGSSGETGGTIVMVAPAPWTPGPPPVINDQLSKIVSDQLYDRLADIGFELNTIGDAGFVPNLARRWTWAADSLSVSFELDPRARWHDGMPVRAKDVAFSFALLKDPAVGSSTTPLLGNIDSVSVRDSMTAVAWFHRRSPEQFYDFVYQIFIMPEHIWAKVPRTQLATSDAARTPVGTGRFRFMRFEPGVRVELIADTSNFRGRAKVDRLVWSVAQDGGAAITQLLTGQADFLELLPPDVVAKVDSAPTLHSIKFAGLLYSYLGFNHRDPKRLTSPHPILGDRRVRRALSMAMDRESMLSNVFGTLGTLGAGPYPRAFADTAVRVLPFDRARAAALLDSAGWAMTSGGTRAKNGAPLTLTLIVPASSRVRTRYAVLIQEQLKLVGANIVIDQMEFGAFQERQTSGKFDAAMMAAGVDPSPSTIKQGWTTPNIGGQNLVRYSSPAFDATIDSATSTFDAARARSTARRAYQIIVDDAPAVWLYDVLAIAGSHKRIRTEKMRRDAWWSNLADWWIPANERLERDRVGLRPATP